MQQLTVDWQVRSDKAAVARRHYVEKRIRQLSSLPPEPSRARQLKKLREELAVAFPIVNYR